MGQDVGSTWFAAWIGLPQLLWLLSPENSNTTPRNQLRLRNTPLHWSRVLLVHILQSSNV